MKEILYQIDHNKAGEEMSSMLMDEEISTYDMFEDLITAYESGNADFKAGMDKALQILIWKNMEELVEHMKKEAMP